MGSIISHIPSTTRAFFIAHFTLSILTPQRPGYFEDPKTPLLVIQVHFTPLFWRVQSLILRCYFQKKSNTSGTERDDDQIPKSSQGVMHKCAMVKSRVFWGMVIPPLMTESL